jgi:uncharacterized SAM-binding protein YcdF (DUF218 family)
VKRARSAGWLLAAVLVLGTLYLAGFAAFFRTLPAPGATVTAKADGIVALTGAGDRLSPAVTLLENGEAKRLLITGVNRVTSKAYLKKLLHGGDAFDCCADLGFAAADTRGNAIEAANWAREHHYGSLIIVTADYHMPRSLVEFGMQMPLVRFVPYAIADSPKTLSWQDFKRLNGEYVKYLASLARAALVRFSRVA